MIPFLADAKIWLAAGVTDSGDFNGQRPRRHQQHLQPHAGGLRRSRLRQEANHCRRHDPGRQPQQRQLDGHKKHRFGSRSESAQNPRLPVNPRFSMPYPYRRCAADQARAPCTHGPCEASMPRRIPFMEGRKAPAGGATNPRPRGCGSMPEMRSLGAAPHHPLPGISSPPAGGRSIPANIGNLYGLCPWPGECPEGGGRRSPRRCRARQSGQETTMFNPDFNLDVPTGARYFSKSAEWDLFGERRFADLFPATPGPAAPWSGGGLQEDER